MKSLSKHSFKELCYNEWMSGINIEYPRYAQIIKDMIGMKEESGTRLFSNDECQYIIDFCSVDYNSYIYV